MRVILGFSVLLILVCIGMGIILWQGERLSLIGSSVSRHHEPIMVLSMTQVQDINEAISELNGYLLTGRKEHKENHKSVVKEIVENLVKIEHKLKDTNFLDSRLVKHTKNLTPLKSALNEFQKLSAHLIFLREHPTQNYPGLALAAETINPISLEYLGLVNSMKNEISQMEFSEKKLRLLSSISELRHTWIQVVNSVRLFLSSHAKNDLNNLNLYFEVNARLIDEIAAEGIDFGFNDIEKLKELLQIFQEKLPAVVEIFLNEQSREDIYLMNTRVKPIVKNLKQQFQNISDSQIQTTKEASNTMVKQINQVQSLAIAVLIISLVFGSIISIIVVKGTTPVIMLTNFASGLSVDEPEQIDSELTGRRDEVGELAKAFARMIERITMSQRYLKHANKNLELRVDERTKELLDKNIELQNTHEELEASHNQLLQSEKMASVGHLAAGVAHEINNPIGYVYSNLSTLSEYVSELLEILDCYAQIEPMIDSAHQVIVDIKQLKDKYDLDYLREDLFDLVAESREGMSRVKVIIQSLKDFSHVDQPEWELTDIHRGINSTLNIISNEIKYKTKVIKNYAELPDIECHPGQINQVFMNLLVNAAHAIVETGEITISTSVEDKFVKIIIQDNGSGIEEKHLNHIFDPFFTTKKVGEGTGLGLSLSYGIIQSHGGEIRVRSEKNKGTSFSVILPINQPLNSDDSSEPG